MVAAAIAVRRSVVLEHFANICPGAPRMAGKSMHEDDTVWQSVLHPYWNSIPYSSAAEGESTKSVMPSRRTSASVARGLTPTLLPSISAIAMPEERRHASKECSNNDPAQADAKLGPMTLRIGRIPFRKPRQGS